MADQEQQTENGMPDGTPDGKPNGKPDLSAYESLAKRETLATVSWYFVATGIVALVLAALCLWMGRTGSTAFFSHKDFALNPTALGRYLLLAGILFYAVGRIITYYLRFRKR
jgi:hypothetical protein